MLMQKIRQDAHERGYPRIELDVWSFNDEAMRFYASVGMRPFRTFMEMDAER